MKTFASAWVLRLHWGRIVALLLLLSTGCGPSDGARRAHAVRVIGFAGRGDGALYQPRGVEALSDGGCLVIDRSGRIQRFDERAGFVGSWWLPEWAEGQPIDLCLTPWGSVLVADTHYARVLEYDLGGHELRRLGTDAGLGLVRGVTVGLDGTIFVVDYGEFDRVHRFDRSGAHQGTFGATGDGPGEFLRPEGIATGADGDVYVVDCGNHRVQRFTPQGVFVAAFGAAGAEPGQFLFPFDVATGSGGCLYVVDYRGARVQCFSPEGALLGWVGGAGTEPGEFATPRGVAVRPDPAGDVIFVADTNNHRVQRFRWEPRP